MLKFLNKIVSGFLVLSILITLLPCVALAAVNDFSTLIYLAADFEEQKVGDAPWGFYQSDIYGQKVLDDFVVAEKSYDGRDDNKAMLLKYAEVDGRTAFHTTEYCPITHDFVFGFDVNFGNTSKTNKVYMEIDTTYPGCNINGRETKKVSFLEFSEILRVGGSPIRGVNFKNDTWYRLDMVISVADADADLYLDGKLIAKSISLNDMETMCGIGFEVPVDGADYYIDNVKLYKGSSLISDEEFNAALTDWKESDLYPVEEYSQGRAYVWDKLLYHTLKGKIVGKNGSKQMWRDNKLFHLSAPIAEDDGVLTVPVRSFCDIFGAVTEWNGDLNKVTVTSGGNKLEYIDGQNVYYKNGRIQKIEKKGTIKDGTFYLPFDLIIDFLEIDYVVDDQLLIFGDEIVIDPDLQPERYLPCCNWTLREELMWRIGCLLTHQLPDAEELLADFKATNPEGTHPRVETDSFEKIKENMAADKAFAKVVETAIATGARSYDNGLVEFKQVDYTSTSIGSMCEKLRHLAFSYVMTKEEKYKTMLVEQMKIIDETGDFTQGQYLSIGTASWYLGNAYDWMYNDFTEEERALLEKIILKVFDGVEKGLTSPYYTSGSSHLGKDHNWNMIISNGWMSCCAALMDKYPEWCSRIAEGIIRSISGLFEAYAPYGVCEEGISYWLYTCDSMVPFINTLECTFGTDYDTLEAPGILNMVDYARSVEGSTGGFNLGDASPQAATHPVFFMIGEKTNNNELINSRKKSAGSPNDMFSWVFDTGESVENKDAIVPDSYFGETASITMRTGWTKTDTAVYFHGGANDDTHGHRDIGNVLFDMNGERWGDEFEKATYGIGTRAENVGYTGGYFRNEGEGHNIVIANLSAENTYGMDKTAQATIEAYSFGDVESFAIMDLTEGNPLYEFGLRGVKLNKITNELIIQDDYKSKVPTHFWWFMNFKNTDIDISDDGRSAILTKNNKKIKATIISDGDEKFQVLEPKPLEHLTHLKAPYDEPNEGYLRLAINNPYTDRFKTTVSFKPYTEGDDTLAVSEDKYMSTWNLVSLERAKLSSVTVDGKPLEGFDPETYTYDIELMTEKEPVPEIAVTAEEGVEVIVNESKTVPGITTVSMMKDGNLVGAYNFGISCLNDTTKFINDKQIPIKSFRVSAEPEPQNPGKHLFDANPETKYATNEIGGTLEIDYGQLRRVADIMMSFPYADRYIKLKIEYSADGENYKVAYDDYSKEMTKELQSFDIEVFEAQYLKISFYGQSTGSNWASITEFCSFEE